MTSVQPDDPLKQLHRAYLSALELSQFKAGFLARTSHELRSPLNGLISCLQLILADLCDSPEEERDYVQNAHDAALKLVEILDQVITVAKVSYGSYPLKLEVVDLDLVLQEVAMLVRMQAANRNLRLHVPLLDEVIEVQADMAGLRQALVMLIDGAISLMQEGDITVSVVAEAPIVKIKLCDDRPIEAWQEAFPPAQLLPLPELVEPTDVDGLTQLPTLSSHFRLVLAKDWFLGMGGNLELIEQDGKIQVQCVLPLAPVA
jgi:nitrogen-specific signal transduction histidine kinase